MIAEFVVVFFGLIVGGSGPTYHDWRARRQARRDAPLARVYYLPTAACREGRCPAPAQCAICKAALQERPHPAGQ